MKSIYKALNSKLAKAIVCSILGLYIVYLVILTISLKAPFDFTLIFQSIFSSHLLLIGLWEPNSPCEPTAYGIEQIFIISLVLIFSIINLFSDKFDDHEILRFSLVFGIFAFLLINFIVYAHSGFTSEMFPHIAWFFPVLIIDGALLLFTIFKMVLCFINRKMVFHRYFLEHGCFMLGIVLTSGIIATILAFVINNPAEYPWSYIFTFGFYGPIGGTVLGYAFGGVFSAAFNHSIAVTFVFSIVFVTICIVRKIKKVVSTSQSKKSSQPN